MSNSSRQTYSTQPYSPEGLQGILQAEEASVEDQDHINYLLRFFAKAPPTLQPKTILIEEFYISVSYLEDYSNYFSLSFNQYDKFCKRVHFFAWSFDQEDFELILLKKDEAPHLKDSQLKESYLGHLVLRPLPTGIIGASILRPHVSQLDAHFQLPGARDYTIHLFGIEFQLYSLAFQSQDYVVSSCSTIALWCAFSKTSELFRTHRPSPSKITLSANNLFLRTGRSLPTTGLDPYQICTAIEATGLVTEMRDSRLISEPKMAKALIYAYLSFGIPVLLGVKVQNDLDNLDNRHLLTIVGFRPPMTWVKGHEEVKRDQFRLRAFDIKEFHVHDDLVGPFTAIKIDNAKGSVYRLNAPPPNEQKSELIEHIFVPVAPLIRITFEQAFFLTQKFWGYVHHVHFVREGVIKQESWDLSLYDSNKYKDDIRRRSIDPFCEKSKKRLLLKALPKYLWVARASIGEELQLDLVFDATDSHMYSCCLTIAIWNPELKELIREDFSNIEFKTFLSDIVELDKNMMVLMEEAVENG